MDYTLTLQPSAAGPEIRQEIDGCTLGSARCAAHASCRNTPRCDVCACDRGYRADGLTNCEPNAACPGGGMQPCGLHAHCFVEGSTYCQAE